MQVLEHGPRMELVRILSACEKKLQENESLMTLVSSNLGIVLGMCFRAHPRCGRQKWVYFGLFITTGYCYVFLCLHGKHIFVM